MQGSRSQFANAFVQVGGSNRRRSFIVQLHELRTAVGFRFIWSGCAHFIHDAILRFKIDCYEPLFHFNYRADSHPMKLALALSLLVSLLSPPALAETNDDIPIYAVSLVGSPYRLGGASPESGLDCSGFVGHVFKQITGLQLPRDSQSISDATQPLAQDELQPGDLVFFNTLNRTFSHVGIYLGEDRFVHASSNRTGQVMVSNLNETYWRTRFDGARRVLDPLPVVTADALFD